MRLHDHNPFGILAKDWHPQPEGKDAQPIWKGRVATAFEQEMEATPWKWEQAERT